MDKYAQETFFFSLNEQKYHEIKAGICIFCSLQPKWCFLNLLRLEDLRLCNHQNIKLMTEAAKINDSYFLILIFDKCFFDFVCNIKNEDVCSISVHNTRAKSNA